MGHTVLGSPAASCLRATVTVRALCFAVFLQTREKRHTQTPTHQRRLGEEDRGKRMTKFVYSRVTLDNHTEDPIYVKVVQSLAFLFFTFVLRTVFGK